MYPVAIKVHGKLIYIKVWTQDCPASGARAQHYSERCTFSFIKECVYVCWSIRVQLFCYQMGFNLGLICLSEASEDRLQSPLEGEDQMVQVLLSIVTSLGVSSNHFFKFVVLVSLESFFQVGSSSRY